VVIVAWAIVAWAIQQHKLLPGQNGDIHPACKKSAAKNDVASDI
jgi:hypothetical protein